MDGTVDIILAGILLMDNLLPIWLGMILCINKILIINSSCNNSFFLQERTFHQGRIQSKCHIFQNYIRILCQKYFLHLNKNYRWNIPLNRHSNCRLNCRPWKNTSRLTLVNRHWRQLPTGLTRLARFVAVRPKEKPIPCPIGRVPIGIFCATSIRVIIRPWLSCPRVFIPT